MKFLFAICALLVIVGSFVSAQPLEHDAEGFAVVSRARRATCDLLSFDTPIGSLNHSACAAHCLVLGKGFKGGRCINGVCNCRR